MFLLNSFLFNVYKHCNGSIKIKLETFVKQEVLGSDSWQMFQGLLLFLDRVIGWNSSGQ